MQKREIETGWPTRQRSQLLLQLSDFVGGLGMGLSSIAHAHPSSRSRLRQYCREVCLGPVLAFGIHFQEQTFVFLSCAEETEHKRQCSNSTTPRSEAQPAVFTHAPEPARTKRVHNAQPYEYDRVMGIGLVSSSAGSLLGIQESGPLCCPNSFLFFRLAGVQKVDLITRLAALVLTRSQGDLDPGASLRSLGNCGRQLLPVPLMV